MRVPSFVRNASFALAFAGCISCSTDAFRTPASEFRALPVAVGNDLGGWQELDKATRASQVISKFGNPSRTEDTQNLLTGERKVYYYDAKDEFGNPVRAALVFANTCRALSDQQDPNNCYRLLQVQVVSDTQK